MLYLLININTTITLHRITALDRNTKQYIVAYYTIQPLFLYIPHKRPLLKSIII